MGVCCKCHREINPDNKPGIYEVHIYRKGMETEDVLHEWCVDSERFGKCRYCGPLIVHPVRELRGPGGDLCTEHVGEDSLDDDERQDLEDEIENRTKDM